MKMYRMTTKKTSLLPLVFLFLLIPSVSLVNIISVGGVGVNATAYAYGILTPAQWDCIVTESYVGMEEQIYMTKLTEVQGFPTDPDDPLSYIVISTGTANEFRGKATDLASDYTRGPTSIDLPPWIVPQVGYFFSYDIARLTLSLEVPAGASILSFDWKFATEELPDEPPQQRPGRDWAMATVTTSAGTENILLLPNRKPVDVYTAYEFFNNASSALGWRRYPIPNDVDFNAVAPHAVTALSIPVYTAWFDVRPYEGEAIQIDFWVADEDDGYDDSALFLDNLRFGPPNGNLQPQGTRAIQTVPIAENVPFVMDKPTAFNITYLSTFPHVVETEIRVDLTGFSIPSYTFAHKFNPGRNYFYVNPDAYPTGKIVSYGVTIDPNDAIPETDEGDNSRSAPSSSAFRIEPHDGWLHLLFVRLHHENEPISDRITARLAELYMWKARDFLRATYPIQRVWCGMKTKPLVVKSGWNCEDILDKLADFGPLYNHVVGVANESWTGWDTSDLFDGDMGFTTDNSRSVVVRTRLILSTVGGVHVETRQVTTVAHEIGHTYGLGDDYPGGSSGARTEICKNGSGYWVEKEMPMIERDTFMHFGGIADDNWVDDSDYNWLLLVFVILDWWRDPEVLLLSGVVFRDGTAELSERLHRGSADETDIAAGSIGNYYIALLDELGNTLSRVGFNVTFNLLSDPPKEVDKEHFSFTMEWAGGTRLIQLQDAEGTVLTAREVSPNPPSVTVNSPNGGETVTPGTDHTITWSATDPDGDHLTYNVLVSNGVDAKPVPIATGLDQTSFTYNFTGLPGGNQYRIHVEANDGVNVGSDVSDDFFTVAFFTIDMVTKPQSILEGGSATYTLNVTSYGGFSHPVTLNAESPTVPALIFQWPGGATVTPVPSGSIIVSMEIYVPARTNGGYHNLIVSGVADNDPQMTITHLFVLSHNIAILDIALSKTTADPGDIISINVTVQNQGAFNEIFDITVYYDTHTIEEQWAYLHAGELKALTFIWNTTGAKSGKYTISAYATPIPDETDIRAPSRETDTADNIFTGDTVVIQPPINIWLLVIVASAAVIIALVSYAAILRWRKR